MLYLYIIRHYWKLCSELNNKNLVALWLVITWHGCITSSSWKWKGVHAATVVNWHMWRWQVHRLWCDVHAKWWHGHWHTTTKMSEDAAQKIQQPIFSFSLCPALSSALLALFPSNSTRLACICCCCFISLSKAVEMSFQAMSTLVTSHFLGLDGPGTSSIGRASPDCGWMALSALSGWCSPCLSAGVWTPSGVWSWSVIAAAVAVSIWVGCSVCCCWSTSSTKLAFSLSGPGLTHGRALCHSCF